MAKARKKGHTSGNTGATAKSHSAKEQSASKPRSINSSIKKRRGPKKATKKEIKRDPHEVFISYSSTDRIVAEAICSTLEERDVYCWMAPRDVLAGIPYSEALIDAINQSSLVVLVFSSNSNSSPQVIREIERAVNKGIPIIPFRIENVPLSKSMEYFISTPHWFDALTPPLEQHLNLLANIVQLSISGQKGETFIPNRQKGVKNLVQEDKHKECAVEAPKAEERLKAEETIKISLREPQSLYLHIRDASGGERVVMIIEWRLYNIGRASDNDIILCGQTVSRHHAFILFTEDQFVIVDGRIESDETIKRSSNGMIVDGQRKYQSKLSFGTVIKIGENMLICSDSERFISTQSEQEVCSTKHPEKIFE